MLGVRRIGVVVFAVVQQAAGRVPAGNLLMLSRLMLAEWSCVDNRSMHSTMSPPLSHRFGTARLDRALTFPCVSSVACSGLPSCGPAMAPAEEEHSPPWVVVLATLVAILRLVRRWPVQVVSEAL